MQKLLPFFLLFCSQLFAQTPEPGAQATALGGSFGCQQHILASYYNVAGTLTDAGTKWAFGARNNYLANNLNQYYGAVSWQKERYAIGTDIMGYGFSAYQEMVLGLNYAQKLSKNWRGGARLKYSYQQIADENMYRHNILADVGFLGIYKSWRVGASLQNFVQSGWMGGTKESTPIAIRVGGGYFVNKKTALTTDFYLCQNQKPDVRLGISYAPADALSLRFGFSSANPSVSFGCGIVVKNIEINLAASWHQQLGLSPVLDVVSQ